MLNREKKRFTRITVAMMVLSLVLPAMLNTNVAMAEDCKLCTGTGSGWTTNEGTDDDCGLCGTETTYTRTVKTCSTTNDEDDSCSPISLVTKKKDKKTDTAASPAAQAVCQAQYDLDVADLDVMLTVCRGLVAADCLLGCAIFAVTGPGYLACVGLCGTGGVGACEIAYALDMNALLCVKTECMNTCVVTAFVTVTTETNACS